MNSDQARATEVAPPAAPEAGSTPTIRVAAPSLREVVRFVSIVVACGIALYLVWRVRGVVRLVGISLFLALALMPIVDALDSRLRVPRSVLILGVYVVLIASVAVIGYVVVPSLVREVGQISHDAPRYAADLRHNSLLRHYDNRYHISATLVRDARRLPELLGHLVGPLKDVTVQAFGLIGQLITVLAITFLLVLHGREYVGMGLSLTGERSERYRQMIIDINQAVAQYVLGNITISVLCHARDLDRAVDPRRSIRTCPRLRGRILRPDPARRRDSRGDCRGPRDRDG